MTIFSATVKPATASVTEFLEAAAPLVAPIDAYFEKVGMFHNLPLQHH
jgi:hypothetical protein